MRYVVGGLIGLGLSIAAMVAMNAAAAGLRWLSATLGMSAADISGAAVVVLFGGLLGVIIAVETDL